MATTPRIQKTIHSYLLMMATSSYSYGLYNYGPYSYGYVVMGYIVMTDHGYRQVMPGEWDEVIPNLESLIQTGEVQGMWPAAKEEWGLYANKLETVLLVEIPAEGYRSADRIVPGRDDVYIIQQSMCDEGKQLDDGDTGRYYSNTHIKACLVLKPPSTCEGPHEAGQRVQCAAAHDHYGCMAGVQVTAIGNDAHVSDKLDKSIFPPKVLVYTGHIAKPVQDDTVGIHSMIAKNFSYYNYCRNFRATQSYDGSYWLPKRFSFILQRSEEVTTVVRSLVVMQYWFSGAS